jgi:hypothetical protein
MADLPRTEKTEKMGVAGLEMEIIKTAVPAMVDGREAPVRAAVPPAVLVPVMVGRRMVRAMVDRREAPVPVGVPLAVPVPVAADLPEVRAVVVLLRAEVMGSRTMRP